MAGADGAGKTTLFRCIAGLLRVDSGRVLPGRAGQARLGFAQQGFHLYPDLTVEENAGFIGSLYGLSRAAAAQSAGELLAFAGLSDRRSSLASELSGGMKQKLTLVCSLLHRPPVLLLDEPTTGVDPLSRLEFWDLFEHLPASLRAATGTIVAVIEADPWQRAYAELAARWPGTTLRGTTIRVSLPAGADPRSLLAESLSTIRVERIRATDPSFEDAFIWFIRHSHPVTA